MHTEGGFPVSIIGPYRFPNGSSVEVEGEATSLPLIFVRAGANVAAFKARGV